MSTPVRYARALGLGCAAFVGTTLAVNVTLSLALYGFVGRHPPAWLPALGALAGGASGTAVAAPLLPVRRRAWAVAPAALALVAFVVMADPLAYASPGYWAWIAAVAVGAAVALLAIRRRDAGRRAPSGAPAA